MNNTATAIRPDALKRWFDLLALGLLIFDLNAREVVSELVLPKCRIESESL